MHGETAIIIAHRWGFSDHSQLLTFDCVPLIAFRLYQVLINMMRPPAKTSCLRNLCTPPVKAALRRGGFA